jgi:hypothetical protein
MYTIFQAMVSRLNVGHGCTISGHSPAGRTRAHSFYGGRAKRAHRFSLSNNLRRRMVSTASLTPCQSTSETITPTIQMAATISVRSTFIAIADRYGADRGPTQPSPVALTHKARLRVARRLLSKCAESMVAEMIS